MQCREGRQGAPPSASSPAPDPWTSSYPLSWAENRLPQEQTRAETLGKKLPEVTWRKVVSVSAEAAHEDGDGSKDTAGGFQEDLLSSSPEA